ncbi:MAG: lytic murein transglycosylase, partial [Myxococcota bacterium]
MATVLPPRSVVGAPALEAPVTTAEATLEAPLDQVVRVRGEGEVEEASPLAAPRPDLQVPRAQSFPEYLEEFRSQVLRQARNGGPEISAATIDRIFDDVEYIEPSRSQREFAQSPADYVDNPLGAAHLARKELEGVRSAAAEHQGPGEDVPIEAAVAIWTIESALGNYMGTENPFSQLASRAFRDESRNTDYAAQLRDALVLVERGMLAPDAQSSNAGALGHTKFMPSSWLDLAVDGDHDGQVDLIGSP